MRKPKKKKTRHYSIFITLTSHCQHQVLHCADFICIYNLHLLNNYTFGRLVSTLIKSQIKSAHIATSCNNILNSYMYVHSNSKTTALILDKRSRTLVCRLVSFLVPCPITPQRSPAPVSAMGVAPQTVICVPISLCAWTLQGTTLHLHPCCIRTWVNVWIHTHSYTYTPDMKGVGPWDQILNMYFVVYAEYTAERTLNRSTR